MPAPASTRTKTLHDRVTAILKGDKAHEQLGKLMNVYLEEYAKGWTMEVLASIISSRLRFRPYLYAAFVEKMLSEGQFAQASAFLATYRTTLPEDEETPPKLVLVPAGNRTPELDLEHLVNIWLTAARFSHLEFVHRVHEAVLERVMDADEPFVVAFTARTEGHRKEFETESLQQVLSEKRAAKQAAPEAPAEVPAPEQLRRVR